MAGLAPTTLLLLLLLGSAHAAVIPMNVRALYGDVTPATLQQAIAAAQHKRASLGAGDEVRVEIDAGAWDVTDVAASALMDVGSKGGGAPTAWLTVAGAGMNVTTLVTGGVKEDIVAHNVQRVRFANLTFERVRNVTTTQGTVTAVDAAAKTVTLRLDAGYPTPLDIFNAASPQGRYLRRYTRNATTGNCDLIVDANRQVAWTNASQAGRDPRVWTIQARTSLQGYAVGTMVGVKSKHEAQSYFMTQGDSVEFASVRFLGHSRGVIRGGISNIKFEDCVVAKRTLSQCLATNGGGPQLGQPHDPVIYNVTVARHTSHNTGDDSVAFFRVGSGAVRDSYIADSFARGILLSHCGTDITLEGNILVRNPLLRDP